MTPNIQEPGRQEFSGRIKQSNEKRMNIDAATAVWSAAAAGRRPRRRFGSKSGSAPRACKGRRHRTRLSRSDPKRCRRPAGLCHRTPNEPSRHRTVLDLCGTTRALPWAGIRQPSRVQKPAMLPAATRPTWRLVTIQVLVLHQCRYSLDAGDDFQFALHGRSLMSC